MARVQGSIAAVLAVAAGASAQSTPWRLVATQGPPERFGFAMAFDSARGRTVLFGGLGPGVPGTRFNDTWEWDGNNWVLRANSGPSFRFHHRMAFDSTRGQTLLFGGLGEGSTTFAETWVWDGAVWMQRAVGAPAPPARLLHSMAFDSARGRVVLFGGWRSGNPSIVMGDTWEWDGASWTQRALTGPSPRSAPAMAFDSTRSVTVLFGGQLPGGARSSETWEWDGSTWQLRSVTGPTGRNDHSMSFDTERDVTLLFGGRSNTALEGGIWSWDGHAWSWSEPEGAPGGGIYYGMVYDTLRQRTILHTNYGFGGCEDGHKGTWERASIQEWCYANCDGGSVDPVLNVSDFICFLNRFAVGDPYANCDQDRNCLLQVNDFVCFTQRFAAECR